MTAPSLSAAPRPTDETEGRTGMTLLEVLIACGVLVTGLASIAALLPAAGSRLGQAAVEDRAGTLAGNAFGDALSRRLVAADMFSNPNRSVAFGRGMGSLPASHFGPPTAKLADRIDPIRGFQLEDELVFAAPAGGTPTNDFPGGVRAYKQNLCWGATLVPESFPVEPGVSAVLSVAVFRREPTTQPISLRQHSGGLFRMDPANESLAKSHLKSCSYVLVMPADAQERPRWFRVIASWMANGNAFLTFDSPGFASFAGPNPTVVGFESLVRVDQRTVILE